MLTVYSKEVILSLFIPITSACIVVTVLIVYFICKVLRVRLKLQALILAAILAEAMTFLSISLSTSLDSRLYLQIGALAVLAALLSTALNEYLIHRCAKSNQSAKQGSSGEK